MKAVVLVGGEGTRLRPLTYTTPKPLLPIGNRAFLEHQLTWLAGHGVDEVVLSLGYLPDAFVEHFPEGRFGDVRLRYAVEPEPLGTAGAIRFAAEGIDERFLVCNGDVLTSLDVTALVKFHEDARAEATIALTQVEDPSAFGVVPTSANGAVRAFVEKPPRDKAPTNWINAGTYVLESAMLDRIPAGVAMSIERVTFPTMLERGAALFALHSDEYWLDIGTPEKYLEAHTDLLAGRAGTRPFEAAVERGAGVWVEGETTIDGDVAGPALVGAGAVVETGAHVSGSTIGPGAVIGREARVVGSVLLAGCRVEPGAEVDSSVIGPAATVGAGASVTGTSVVGAGASVAPSTRLAGARVDPPGRPG